MMDSENSPKLSPEELQKQSQMAEESYNGAVRDKYSWAQTINEVDVYIPVTSNILKGKQLRVVTNALDIAVSALVVDAETSTTRWDELVKGNLSWKTNKNEAIWSLVPGKRIQIHLEKVEERWWDSLLVDEQPKIDLKLIDSTRPMEELSEAEQMRISELVCQETDKRLGKVQTPRQTMETTLKEAWDLEGSPFRGTPYDAAKVNMQFATTNDK